ncbi:hypothetical protein EDB83DRAFT_96691 [Lactarius deliciosus]|nr:hypothetical protein EDB83DRAFT_96691 [Lactarius deliciosus]
MSSHSDRSVSPPSFTEPVLSIGHPSSGHPSLPNDSSAGTTSHDPHNGLKVENITRTLCVERGEIQAQGQSPGHVITINYLPDDVLLEIFNSCRKDHNPDQSHTPVWRWDGLVHVCQRWRQLVFGSPRRLDLQLLCTNGTRVLENLDCWPPLPIAVQYLDQDLVSKTFTPDDKDSLFAALWHRDRICHVDLGLTGLQLAEVAAVMQESFPALTHLSLQRTDGDPPTLPINFLGGSAPYLQHLDLEGLLFPALSTLLSSTSNLVKLYLEEIPPWIPQGGLISPEAMVACLAALPRLKHLSIGFISTTFHVDPIRSPPETQILLPALTSFGFQGASQYRVLVSAF